MRNLIAPGIALLLAGCATPLAVGERPTVSPAELDEITAVVKRDFHERGIAKMDRIELDAVMRLCNLHNDNPPSDQARPVEEALLKSIPFPAGGLMGDWKRGESIAQSGRGMTFTDQPGQAGGGSCYNCHELSPREQSHGTLGPSLRGFGKVRGNGADMQRYVYGKIFNSKAYNACSQMPRLGASGTLSEQQIKDLVALLLDPASPVNQ